MIFARYFFPENTLGQTPEIVFLKSVRYFFPENTLGQTPEFRFFFPDLPIGVKLYPKLRNPPFGLLKLIF